MAGIGSAISSGNNRRAANNAAQIQSDASQRATDTSQRATDASIGLQRDIYNQNQQTLAPFVGGGVAAASQINALLGLSPQQQPAQQQMQPNALSQFQGAPGGAGMPYNIGDGAYSINNGIADTRFDPAVQGNIQGGFGFNQPGGDRGPPTNAVAAPTPAVTQQSAQGAFDQFRNFTGYQFRLGEGMDAINSGFAGGGIYQSGARDKELMRFGQGIGSQEFGNFMGYLSQQQGAGLQAAGAQAGVGVNYANSAAQLNTANAYAQANAANQQANALGNAALISGNNNVFGNVLGTVGGGLLGYGLGR